jgi:ferredoxin--NADP+ reductase
VQQLKELGFDAVLVTVGAQGTKWLGLPGEELKGVYHAKDLVYHYNKLPPFSEQEFPIGRRVVCIGVGNVMLDIAHWTIRDLKVDEIIAVARRGPDDVKFTKKEMELVAKNLDLKALDAEIERTAPIMAAVGQDSEAAKTFITSALEHAQEPVSDTRFRFEFLASPIRIVGDENGCVTGLEVEDTTLESREGGGTKAAGLGTMRVIEADTVVFCIGDRVDETFGLPLDQWKEFAKHPEPKFPVGELSYEAYDPIKKEEISGIFLAGWAREASSGLVGAARKDGTQGAQAVLQYLQTLPAQKDPAGLMHKLGQRLEVLPHPVVRKPDWQKLEETEQAKADVLKLPEFKFSSNQDMLDAIGLNGRNPA